MPTKEEAQELIDNCDWAWKRHKGVRGVLFTSKKNGQRLFLPAAGMCTEPTAVSFTEIIGDYWCGTRHEDEDVLAYVFGFCENHIFDEAHNFWGDVACGGEIRIYGRPIRPVIE